MEAVSLQVFEEMKAEHEARRSKPASWLVCPSDPRGAEIYAGLDCQH